MCSKSQHRQWTSLEKLWAELGMWKNLSFILQRIEAEKVADTQRIKEMLGDRRVGMRGDTDGLGLVAKAYAIELGLKGLLLVEDKQEPTHDLLCLYKMLHDRTRTTLDREYQEWHKLYVTQGRTGLDPELTVVGLLTAHRNDFVETRYWGEFAPNQKKTIIHETELVLFLLAADAYLSESVSAGLSAGWCTALHKTGDNSEYLRKGAARLALNRWFCEGGKDLRTIRAGL